MDKMIIALFRYHLQAQEAIGELQEQGISPEQIKIFSTIGNQRGGFKIATIGTSPDDRFADMKSELFESLTSWGVPKSDAFFFTEGVRRGDHLLLVLTHSADPKAIIQTLQKHGALELTSRKLFYEELNRRPTEGLSASPFTQIKQETHYPDELADWVRQHKDEIGPEVKVKVYNKPPEPENLGVNRNLNE